VIVGHSMGGLVARYVIADMPAAALVIVDSRSLLYGEGVDRQERATIARALLTEKTDNAFRARIDTYFVAASPQAVR
jgi:alpha-beta hydrolase superfamily lysophospholipase